MFAEHRHVRLLAAAHMLNRLQIIHTLQQPEGCG